MMRWIACASVVLGFASAMARPGPTHENAGGALSVHCARAVETHAQNATGHDTFEILRVVPVVASARQFACAVRGQRVVSGKAHKSEARLWLFAMRLDEQGGAVVDPSSSWSEIPVRP